MVTKDSIYLRSGAPSHPTQVYGDGEPSLERWQRWPATSTDSTPRGLIALLTGLVFQWQALSDMLLDLNRLKPSEAATLRQTGLLRGLIDNGLESAIEIPLAEHLLEIWLKADTAMTMSCDDAARGIQVKMLGHVVQTSGICAKHHLAGARIPKASAIALVNMAAPAETSASSSIVPNGVIERLWTRQTLCTASL